MDTLINVKAFLRVSRLHSFVSAARELEVAPSVVTKRVTQLEKSLGARLLERSTRGLALTSAGERYLPRLALLIAEYEDIFESADSENRKLEGHLRILSAPTITSLFLGEMLSNFQAQNPDVDMSIVLMDRPVNPLEEGHDIALGARPTSYPGVLDVALCPYELVACCAPSYLQGKEKPQHPTELVRHKCLTTMLFKTHWAFTGRHGTVTVDVHSRMQSSDMLMVREAARMGLGITLLPCFLVNEDIHSGRLISLLEDFPVAPFVLKALVPRMKIHRPTVRALVAYLKSAMKAVPPSNFHRSSSVPVS